MSMDGKNFTDRGGGAGNYVTAPSRPYRVEKNYGRHHAPHANIRPDFLASASGSWASDHSGRALDPAYGSHPPTPGHHSNHSNPNLTGSSDGAGEIDSRMPARDGAFRPPSSTATHAQPILMGNNNFTFPNNNLSTPYLTNTDKSLPGYHYAAPNGVATAWAGRHAHTGPVMMDGRSMAGSAVTYKGNDYNLSGFANNEDNEGLDEADHEIMGERQLAAPVQHGNNLNSDMANPLELSVVEMIRQSFPDIVGNTRRCDALAPRPAMRQAQLRPDIKESDLKLGRREKREALYAQTAGEKEAVACSYCARGCGPWTECITVEGEMMGACANCWSSAEGSRCNFHESKKQGRQQAPAVPPAFPALPALPALPAPPVPVMNAMPPPLFPYLEAVPDLKALVDAAVTRIQARHGEDYVKIYAVHVAAKSLALHLRDIDKP